MLDTLGDCAEFVLQHMDVDDLVTISKVSPGWERVLVDNKKQVRRCGVKPAMKFPSLMQEMWVHLYYWRGFANACHPVFAKPPPDFYASEPRRLPIPASFHIRRKRQIEERSYTQLTEIHNLYCTVQGSCQKVKYIDSEVINRLRQLTDEYNFSDIETRKDFKTATENLIKINAMIAQTKVQRDKFRQLMQQLKKKFPLAFQAECNKK